MATLSELQTRKTALEAAIHSGVQSVTVDGVTTGFGSLSDIRGVLADLIRQIQICEGRNDKRPRAAQVWLGGF